MSVKTGVNPIFNILQWATSPISHLGLSTEEEVSLAARLHPLLLEAESGGQDVLDLVQDDDNLALIFIVLEMALEKAIFKAVAIEQEDEELKTELKRKLTDIIRLINNVVARNFSSQHVNFALPSEEDIPDDPAIIRWLIVLYTLMLFQASVAFVPRKELTHEMLEAAKHRMEELSKMILELFPAPKQGLDLSSGPRNDDQSKAHTVKRDLVAKSSFEIPRGS